MPFYKSTYIELFLIKLQRPRFKACAKKCSAMNVDILKSALLSLINSKEILEKEWQLFNCFNTPIQIILCGPSGGIALVYVD